MQIPILTFPHSLLHQKTKEVKTIEIPKYQNLIADMIETLNQAQGIGLAANQIGQDLQIAVLSLFHLPLVLINPKIISHSWRKEETWEGCLSIPDQLALVKRYKTVKIKAWDQTGKKIKLKAKDLLARAIQHEIDHLKGILNIDKAIEIKRVGSDLGQF